VVLPKDSKKEFLEVTEVFDVLIVMVIPQICTCGKINRPIHEKNVFVSFKTFFYHS
jgi:hypothetical protein